MARARADSQRSRSKTAQIDEITQGIKKFEEVLAAVKDYSRDGFPYRDAAQSKAELQFRECLRHTFGDRSEEFQKYRNFKLRTGDKAEATQSVAAIKGLIQTLEDRKLELQGLKPPPKPDPPSETSVNNTARLVLVTPGPATTVTAQSTTPLTVAVAMTTNVGPSISPVTPTPSPSAAIPEPKISQPTPPPSLAPTPSPAPTPAPVATEPPWFSPPTPASHAAPPSATASPTQLTPVAPEMPTEGTHAPLSPVTPPPTVSSAQPIPAAHEMLVAVQPTPPPSTPPTTASSVQPMPAAPEKPVEAQPTPPPPMPPVSTSPPTQPHVCTLAPAQSTPATPLERSQTVAPPLQNSAPDKPSTSPSHTPSTVPALDHDPLHLIRKVCLRFHAVARQLRLRKDDRQTLEVNDDYDLQDLLCALLKVEFDEVATDEWMPSYTGGEPRTMLLVNKDDIAVVAKKTKAGLTPKELTDQVTTDSAYFRAQGRCSTLFCFLYDPDGRIGSPKRLETTLTSVSEHFRVEVLVAPK